MSNAAGSCSGASLILRPELPRRGERGEGGGMRLLMPYPTAGGKEKRKKENGLETM